MCNVSKAYRIWRDPSARLKAPLWDTVGALIPKKLRPKALQERLAHQTHSRYYKDFYALRDVSFEVKKGEAMGIIGRNGSGKSTLLQMIAGTLTPTSGNIKVNGRVAALLELGSGFNPDFTGRENVYLNASVLGLTREEIDKCIDAILAFADIGEFIDQPVKTYSSGMAMRLAFAVIAHVEADIFIIDEAFAVGDVFFQQKCMRFLREFQERNGTFLFVSHDMASISSLCQRAVLLKRKENDQEMIEGSPEMIGKLYLGEIYAERSETLVNKRNNKQLIPTLPSSEELTIRGDPMEQMHVFISPFQKNADNFGDEGGTIEDAYFTDGNGERIEMTYSGRAVNLVLEATCRKDMIYPAFGFMIKDRTGQYLIAEGTDRPFRSATLRFKNADRVKITFSFEMPVLIKGDYSINLAFAEGPGDDHVQHHWIHDALVLKVAGQRLVHGLVGMPKMIIDIALTTYSEK